MQTDAVADAANRGLNGVVRQVCVPRRGAVPPMPEQLAHQGEALARHDGLAGGQCGAGHADAAWRASHPRRTPASTRRGCADIRAFMSRSKTAVGVHVAPDQRRQGRVVAWRHGLLPARRDLLRGRQRGQARSLKVDGWPCPGGKHLFSDRASGPPRTPGLSG